VIGVTAINWEVKFKPSSSAIAERPRCRVGQFWPKLEDDILQTTTVTWSASKAIEFCEITAVTPFKVTDVGTNRKPVCNFLLVINTNWHPISYPFEVIADFCSNFGRKRPPFSVRLGLFVSWIHRRWLLWMKRVTFTAEHVTVRAVHVTRRLDAADVAACPDTDPHDDAPRYH